MFPPLSHCRLFHVAGIRQDAGDSRRRGSPFTGSLSCLFQLLRRRALEVFSAEEKVGGKKSRPPPEVRLALTRLDRASLENERCCARGPRMSYKRKGLSGPFGTKRVKSARAVKLPKSQTIQSAKRPVLEVRPPWIQKAIPRLNLSNGFLEQAGRSLPSMSPQRQPKNANQTFLLLPSLRSASASRSSPRIPASIRDLFE